MATGLPDNVISSITADPSGFFVLLATATALPSAYKGLPSDVQSYPSSMGAAEASIINKDTGNNAVASGIAMKAADALMAAGAVGFALLSPGARGKGERMGVYTGHDLKWLL